jgi:hypothetical protein
MSLKGRKPIRGGSQAPHEGPKARRGLPSGGVAGGGGWLRLFFGRPEDYPVDVYARVERRGGQFEIAELHITALGDSRLDARLMRDLSYDGIRRFANNMLTDLLDQRMTVGRKTFADEIWRSQFELDQFTVDRDGEEAHSTDPALPPGYVAMKDVTELVDATVVLPPGRKRTDEFYRQIADLFERLSAVDRTPAATIAKFNGLSIMTVHGWVREARSRGFMKRGSAHKSRVEPAG